MVLCSLRARKWKKFGEISKVNEKNSRVYKYLDLVIKVF